jgi:hypothetical protein
MHGLQNMKFCGCFPHIPSLLLGAGHECVQLVGSRRVVYIKRHIRYIVRYPEDRGCLRFRNIGTHVSDCDEATPLNRYGINKDSALFLGS